MSRHPEVKWAQRSDKIFLTVELPDAKNPKVKIEPDGKFTFFATAGSENQTYELELDLYDKINSEESKISVTLRNIICVLQKAEKGWWKKLLKGEGKAPAFLKVDWNKWVDEDEEKEGNRGNNFDLGGMDDFSNFDMDEPDSDDEDLPDANTSTEDVKYSMDDIR